MLGLALCIAFKEECLRPRIVFGRGDLLSTDHNLSRIPTRITVALNIDAPVDPRKIVAILTIAASQLREALDDF